MTAKIHKYGTKSYEDHVEGATERGEPHVYAILASRQCVGGVPKRTRHGSTSKWSIAKHYGRMVVTGVTSREAAAAAVRRVLRPSARGAGGGCKVIVDAWRLKA
jgi:hypothetical protein